jgi:transcription elongation factor Elf1
MAETLRCPHCAALYEIRYDKAVSDDNGLAHCQVCGKQMDARKGSTIRHYELVKMPDGTNV